MYKSFFGFKDLPFRANPDPHFLCMTPHTREALACLQYGIADRKGFVVMTGEAGTGKTTLLRSVLSWFPESLVSTAFVFNPKLEAIDFLEFVLTDFGIPFRERNKSGMLLQLNRWLIDRYQERNLCVIVVDEAQDLSPDLLEEIRLLTNLETSSDKLLQIVLSGQPELEEMLHLPSLRQLRQRVALWCRTQALSLEDTRAYISKRIHIAGGHDPIFSAEAVHLVHQYSGGIPRLVNLVCEHSMIQAYAEQIKFIPPRIVESIGKDLRLLDIPVPARTFPVDAPPETAEMVGAAKVGDSTMAGDSSRKEGEA